MQAVDEGDGAAVTDAPGVASAETTHAPSHAAMRIQAVARGTRTRKRVRTEGEAIRHAATTINAHAHGYLARQQIHDMHDSACLIQATFRGHRTRHEYLQSALKAAHVRDHRELSGAAAFFAVVKDAQEATHFYRLQRASKHLLTGCWKTSRAKHSLLSVAAPQHEKTEHGAWVEKTIDMSDGQAVQLFWAMLATG